MTHTFELCKNIVPQKNFEYVYRINFTANVMQEAKITETRHGVLLSKNQALFKYF